MDAEQGVKNNNCAGGGDSALTRPQTACSIEGLENATCTEDILACVIKPVIQHESHAGEFGYTAGALRNSFDGTLYVTCDLCADNIDRTIKHGYVVKYDVVSEKTPHARVCTVSVHGINEYVVNSAETRGSFCAFISNPVTTSTCNSKLADDAERLLTTAKIGKLKVCTTPPPVASEAPSTKVLVTQLDDLAAQGKHGHGAV